MQFIKYSMLQLVFISSTLIGKYIAQHYYYRLKELEDIKTALNILKSKIKFTYEPLPEIFNEIAQNINKNIAQLFENSTKKMENKTATEAWNESIEEYKGNLTEEDKQVIKTLSKMLGTTDSEGQINQIEVTENFLDNQIRQAQEEKNKNEKLYKKLGSTIGLAIVIILI